MNHILDPQHRSALLPFFASNSLLAFDYDGTLAPIASKPAGAAMRPETGELLSRVAHRYPVVIITGRARRDVLPFLHGVAYLEVIGNHGIEVAGVPPPLILKRVRTWLSLLSERLSGIPGLTIEDKRYSLCVHYRACPNPEAIAARVLDAAQSLPGARLVGGKFALNVVLQEAPDKGAALQRLRARLGGPPAVFVGDDITDEDAFVLADNRTILGVRIGADPESAAEYFLRDQAEIDELLVALEDGARGRGEERGAQAAPASLPSVPRRSGAK